MTLKKTLIKLGSTNPELRPHIYEILKHANRFASEDDQSANDSALLNLRELLHNVGLKKYSAAILKEVGNLLSRSPAKKQEVAIPVKVPEGFESLFSTIDIYVRTYQDVRKDGPYTHLTLEWAYKHPSGGGNGLSLGVAATNGWRTNSGKTGVHPQTLVRHALG